MSGPSGGLGIAKRNPISSFMLDWTLLARILHEPRLCVSRPRRSAPLYDNIVLVRQWIALICDPPLQLGATFSPHPGLSSQGRGRTIWQPSIFNAYPVTPRGSRKGLPLLGERAGVRGTEYSNCTTTGRLTLPAFKLVEICQTGCGSPRNFLATQHAKDRSKPLISRGF
jgi:hypothetical protein